MFAGKAARLLIAAIVLFAAPAIRAADLPGWQQARWGMSQADLAREESDLLDALAALGGAIDTARLGVTGHSMGGHGALVAGLRRPDLFASISAFSPIAAPSACPWGRKAFPAYLGPDPAAWAALDQLERTVGRLPPLHAAALLHLADTQLKARFDAAFASVEADGGARLQRDAGGGSRDDAAHVHGE